jgi:hypothetical protein
MASAAEKAEFEEKGYTLVKGLFSQEEVELLYSACKKDPRMTAHTFRYVVVFVSVVCYVAWSILSLTRAIIINSVKDGEGGQAKLGTHSITDKRAPATHNNHKHNNQFQLNAHKLSSIVESPRGWYIRLGIPLWEVYQNAHHATCGSWAKMI